MSFQKFIECWNDTKHTCQINKNFAPKSIKYSHNNNLVIPPCIHTTNISIVNQDTLEAGIDLVSNNRYPLVLNLADNNFPGGHVDMGSGAQEESIFRRTNYFTTLNYTSSPRLYPILDTEAIYSPSIMVIKNGNLEYTNRTYLMSFVACPGIKHPELVDGHLSITDKERLFIKIETVFQIALYNNHDSLVLGALGCGAWNNPPEDVIEIYKDVIKKWDGVFKTIVFAILEIDNKDYIVKNKSMFRKSNWHIFNENLHA